MLVLTSISTDYKRADLLPGLQTVQGSCKKVLHCKIFTKYAPLPRYIVDFGQQKHPHSVKIG